MERNEDEDIEADRRRKKYQRESDTADCVHKITIISLWAVYFIGLVITLSALSFAIYYFTQQPIEETFNYIVQLLSHVCVSAISVFVTLWRKSQ